MTVPESWSETHAAMVDAMSRLDRALQPHMFSGCAYEGIDYAPKKIGVFDGST
jgi:hypothetical protein